ncbi:MAG TPA: Calx-beta domain-containing protein [Pyrinomonadaceae bacterium]|nr:Calx-beta domain-containing protein [Pyrinomonadaceae bacterium]
MAALIMAVCLPIGLSTRAATLSQGSSPVKGLLSNVGGYRLLTNSLASYLAPLDAGETDLSVTKTSLSESAQANTDVTFTIAVSNDSTEDAADVTVTDNLPTGILNDQQLSAMTFVSLTQNTGPTFTCNTPSPGTSGQIDCTVSSLAAGESASFTLVGHIPSETPQGAYFTNVATVTTSMIDVNDENNSGTATVFVPTTNADLGVSKIADTDNVKEDSDVTYTIELRNSGPDAAVNASWEDTLPGDMTFVSLSQTSGPTFSCTTPAVGAGGTITCTLASFAVGQVAVFKLVGHIPSGSSASYANTSTIKSDTQDLSQENNSATYEVTVAPCFFNPSVTNGADSGPGSLRQAIQDACPGATLIISAQVVSQITLTSGELLVNKPLAIQGPGATQLTVRRDPAAVNSFRIFNVTSSGVTISGMTITGGSSGAGNNGGGVVNDGGLLLRSVAVTGNSAGGNGGGVYNNNALTIINSTISGNASVLNGGGIYNNNGSPNIINTTISGNAAQGNGGGIYVNNGSPALTNVTVTNNRADSNNAGGETGGGIFVNAGSPLLKNTIVAGNFRGTGPIADDISGGLVNNTSSFNLIGTGGSGGLTSNNGNQVNVANPRLGQLASNGGPTQTHALLAGSAALDAGSNALLPTDSFDMDADGETDELLPVDQRGPGFQRMMDAGDADTVQTVDIGAFEAQVSLEDIPDKATNEDTPLSFNFNVGDASVIISVSAISSDTTLVPNANLSVTGTGSTRTLQITPVANLSGTTTISVAVLGPNAQVMQDTFVLTVNAVNDAPVAVNDSYTTDEDTPLNVAAPGVLGNDTDIDGPNMTAVVVNNPANGTVTLNPNGSFLYTPKQDFSGADSFTYKANDGSGDSNVATVNITVNAVNDAPVAVNDSYSTNENTPLNVAAPGVLGNDTDIDSGSRTAAIATNPANGTVTLNSNGSFLYTPNAGFSGTDTFTYKANDGSADSSAATVSITVNDGGAFRFSSATYSVAENGGSADITITRTGGSAGTATVLFSTSSGTAGASDYTTVSQTVTFSDGETSKVVNVSITDDALDEADETINLSLSQPGGTGQLGTPATAVLTITDNDPAPSLSINDVGMIEGHSGTKNFIFTVTLSAASAKTVTVDYATADGTATAGSDYQSASGTLTFAPGDLTKTITVQVSGDTLNEPVETFFVNLTNAQNATISDSQGLGTIPNDDEPTVQFTQSSYQIREDAHNTPQGFTSLTIEVVRGGDTSVAATVKYFTSDASGGNECDKVMGQASQRCDYAMKAGTLRFAAGEANKTIEIPIIDDGYKEGNEFFSIQLQSPVGVSLGSLSQANIMIEDDDTVATTPQQNPYLNNSFFVRQNYLDYLYREPDQNGFNDWVTTLNNCGPQKGFLGAPPNCDRAHVTHGFFAAPEHIDTGFLIYRMYEVGMGRLPRYAEFVPDMSGLSGFGLSDAVKQQNLADYIAEFAAKQEFTNRFSDALQPSQAATLIQKLEQAAGVTLPATATTAPNQPTQYGRQELINLRANGTFTVGQTLKAFVEQKPVYDRFFERGHVTLLYFAHLRRDPDLNDPNLTGWSDWVDVFTNGRPSQGIAPHDIHHLIFGFIYSEEYRKRFGQP